MSHLFVWETLWLPKTFGVRGLLSAVRENHGTRNLLYVPSLVLKIVYNLDVLQIRIWICLKRHMLMRWNNFQRHTIWPPISIIELSCWKMCSPSCFIPSKSRFWVSQIRTCVTDHKKINSHLKTLGCTPLNLMYVYWYAYKSLVWIANVQEHQISNWKLIEQEWIKSKC